MVVVVPTVRTNVKGGTLLVGGWDNTDPMPDGTGKEDQICIKVALASGATCTVLRQVPWLVVQAHLQVPNQPIEFLAEQPPVSREEDAIIAYAWNYFFDHPEQTEWLPRLPMTKVGCSSI